MPQYTFGTGNIFITPSSANPTPILVGAIQDVSVDFDGDLKQLFGQYQYALDNARGKVKLNGKFSTGKVDSKLWNATFFGGASATGQTLFALNEAAAVPGTPYQVTVANAAHYTADLGVFNAATGLPLQRVASSPATGQYSVNTSTGVYTFAAADTTNNLLFNYEYTASATGLTIAGTNQLMGTIPVFRLDLANNTKGKQMLLTLYACVANKLSFPLKLDDYGIMAVDFAAQDDGTGRVFNWSTTEG